MMRAEANAAFFAHVLERPASPAQQDQAERRTAERRAAAQEMRSWATPRRHRLRWLLSGRVAWHEPDLPHDLLAPPDAARAARQQAAKAIQGAAGDAPVRARRHVLGVRGSVAVARVRPVAVLVTARSAAGLHRGEDRGADARMWQRCSSCTTHQLEDQWGGQFALPDFDGEQWTAMLPPTLRAIFAPDPPKPQQTVARPKPLAVIAARCRRRPPRRATVCPGGADPGQGRRLPGHRGRHRRHPPRPGPVAPHTRARRDPGRGRVRSTLAAIARVAFDAVAIDLALPD